MNQRKAALIELDNSHDECLYSQLLFLQHAGYETTLICSDKLQMQVADFGGISKQLFFNTTGVSEFRKIQTLWQIRKTIINQGIKMVIFNSAHGQYVRNLLWMPFPSDIRFAGTMHGINKLRPSATQLAISLRMPKYFLLNDFLLDNLKLVPHKGLRFASYYPIFFPDFNDNTVKKPADEYWIAVPGQVENERRDYERLIKAFATLQPKPNFRFLLLGKSDHPAGDGPALRALCASLGVADHFRFWEGFLDNRLFHAYIKVSDVVMPLIHPGNAGFEKYRTNQITGGYNLAFAYKKPLLMLDMFRQYADFRENAVFYELSGLADALATLPEHTQVISREGYKQAKWTFEAQSQRYVHFLEQ